MDEDLRSQQNRQWLSQWARIGPALSRIRRDELRRFRYEDHRDEIDALLEAGCRSAISRQTSGLIEFQRILSGKYCE